MTNKAKFAVITAFLGKTKDRFCEYQEDRTIEEKLKLVSEIKGVSGIEIVYPYETPEPEILNDYLQRYKLSVAAVNCNIKADPLFSAGAITSVDKKIRKKSVEFLKGAKDYAYSVSADKVHVAPLNDGFDYLFQQNYSFAWKYLIEAFKEICDYLPEINLVIEYKESEPRVNCFIDSAAKALLICDKVGRENIGITLDFGHSLQCGENPANELCIIAESGLPYYIHINDNNKKWDWDLFAGSHNFLSYVEFIFWLKEYKYNDFLSSDTAPCRLDIKKTFKTNVRVTSKIWEMLEDKNREKMKKLMDSGDYFKTWKLIEKDIFKL